MSFEKLTNIEKKGKQWWANEGDILYKVHKPQYNIYSRNTEARKIKEVFCL